MYWGKWKKRVRKDTLFAGHPVAIIITTVVGQKWPHVEKKLFEHDDLAFFFFFS